MKPKGKKNFFRSKEIDKNIKETACSMKNTELGKEWYDIRRCTHVYIYVFIYSATHNNWKSL